MNLFKSALTVAVAGLTVSSNVFAMPGFTEQAPFSSIEICVAKISDEANYQDAARVRHEVASEERRVGGHMIKIATQVFEVDGAEPIREYATVCAITANQETKRFAIREKSL